MKKLVLTILCLVTLTSMVACSKDAKQSSTDKEEKTNKEATTEGAATLTGTGVGFGNGKITVTVTMDGNKIKSVVAEGENQTEGIGTKALDELPGKIVEANSTEVDVIAGATVTSEGIINAVNNALDPEKYPAPVDKTEEKEPASVTAAEVYQGFGLSNVARTGPGKDDQDVQVWSINTVVANTLFDEEGKILSLYVDVLEVATPNYDGDGMPHFSGFPGQGGYNFDENHDGVVDTKTVDTEENFLAEVNSWVTKRDRGEAYVMNAGNWASQMDAFQDIFVGMTVDEVEEWFAKYTSDLNGRPLKVDSDKDEDKAKYEKLTEEEKTMLADVVTGATMSLNDGHGNILAAIRNSFDNRQPLEVTKAASQGFGFVLTPRIGPGSDDQEVPVYSINQIYASALFDEDGRIADLFVDVLEVATPNYDGDGMPHFGGFPGQGGYNFDENHDAVVDGKTEDTPENFEAEVESWVTKRQRGDAYVMGAGTWASQMDTFEDVFVGMTVEEVEEWFNKYTSDINGRPLKAGSDKEEDKSKYEALTEEEKAMLADVVTGATMSLKDAHGDIITAIKEAFEKSNPIELTVE